MSLYQGVLSVPAPSRSVGSAAVSVPVLIQVPALAPRHSRTSPRIPTVRLRPRNNPELPKPRRRLRREIRLAGSAILCSVSMIWALLSLWSGSPLAGAATSQAKEPTISATEAPKPSGLSPSAMPEPPEVEGPWASISLEPVPRGIDPNLEGPVVQPAGYLLPEPSEEEPQP